MRRSLSCLTLVLLANAGLASEPPPPVQYELAKVGDEVAALHCGPKAKRIRQWVRNRHDETIQDQRETIQCKNLVLVIYHATIYKPPLKLLESLTLRGAHPKLPKAISPGATRNAVLAYAGTPMTANQASLVYLLNDEGPDQHTATFNFANGKLTSITWWWSSQ